MNINLSETAVDLLLNILNIVILFFVVKALVYKPVRKFLDDRTSRVNEETSKAQKILDEANETLSIKDKMIEETKNQAEINAQKIFNDAKLTADSIVSDAKINANEIKQKAQEEIKIQRENMIANSKDEIAALAVNIAERILERETNEEDNRKIIDDFFGNEENL